MIDSLYGQMIEILWAENISTLSSNLFTFAANSGTLYLVIDEMLIKIEESNHIAYEEYAGIRPSAFTTAFCHIYLVFFGGLTEKM